MGDRIGGVAVMGDAADEANEMCALALLELNPGASFDAARAACRRLAKANHPNLKPGDAEAGRASTRSRPPMRCSPRRRKGDRAP